MDETIYQCAECNFNADNLTELDSHIIGNVFSFSFFLIIFNIISTCSFVFICRKEFHSNKNGNTQNTSGGGGVDASYDEDQINYNNINGITNDDYDDDPVDDDVNTFTILTTST